MFRRSRVSLAAALAVGGVAMVATGTAIAQDSGQRVEVTGSRIKRADAETAAPVQIISREEIERTGKQSIQEVLRGLTGDSQGSIPASFSNGFAAGSAAVSLRGLGVNSTLVLVNGRRMTTYGLADDGTRNFVDLNTIPLEAVDRVEVLKDGASAIYGADAVGGVVNIILRRSYKGGSIGGSYGQTGHNDGRTTRAFGSIGFGDLDADKFNAFVTLEASKQQRINSTDRGFIGESDLRSLNFWNTSVGAPRSYLPTGTGGGRGATVQIPAGVAIDPNAGTTARNLIPCTTSIDPTSLECTFNPRTFQDVQPKTDRVNLFGRGTLALSPAMSVYAEVGVFNTKTWARGTPTVGSDTGVFNPSNPASNPFTTHYEDPVLNPLALPTIPAGHPDNPLGVDAALGIRPLGLGTGDGRGHNSDNTVTRLIAGVQGNVANWDYDIGAGYIGGRLKDQNTGFLIASRFQQALSDGTFRIDPGLMSRATLDFVSPNLDRTAKSSIHLFDAKVSRSLFDLPGGPLGLALGTEYRVEKASTPAVPFTDVADVIGLGFSAFSATRDVNAVYGEITAPVLKSLELSGAVRFDHYSDFGNSTTPKVGFKFKPIDLFAIRGTYSEAFRAPGPAELGGSTFGFTTVGVLSLGNPRLRPEKAKAYTLGLIIEPIQGTSATIDFYQVKRKDEIVQADPALILPGVPLTGTPFTRAPGAQPDTFVYYDVNGDLANVSGPYQNAASTKTTGFDVELRHRMNLGEVGKLTAQLFWSHLSKFQRTTSDGTTFEYAGTHGPIVLSSGAGTPKDKATLSFTLERGPWTGSVAVNWVGSMKLVDHEGEQAVPIAPGFVADPTNGLRFPNNGDLNCGVFLLDGTAPNGCRLPSFTTVDLFGKWSPTKNLDINFSIQNLLDKKPPFDPYLAISYGINYNQAFHQSGAVGRFFTVGAKYTF
jgi:iron complex outermembrane recepter protein